MLRCPACSQKAMLERARVDLKALALPPGAQVNVEAVGTYGNVTTTTRDADGKLQSVNGLPSERKMYSLGGGLKQELWHDKGKLHSIGDEPSRIVYREDGTAKRKAWHTRGVAGRQSDGLMSEEYHPHDGLVERLYRGDEPGCSRRVTYVKGIPTIEQYRSGKGLHRLDGPAQVGVGKVSTNLIWAIHGQFVEEHMVAGYNLGIAVDNTPAMEFLGDSDWRNMTADSDELALIMTLFPNP